MKQTARLSPPISLPFHHFHLIFEHKDLRIVELWYWSQFERGGRGSSGRPFLAEGELEEGMESHWGLASSEVAKGLRREQGGGG